MSRHPAKFVRHIVRNNRLGLPCGALSLVLDVQVPDWLLMLNHATDVSKEEVDYVATQTL